MDEFEQHLKSLWQEGGRDVAVSFLKRAVNAKISLEELLAALQFEAVAPHLHEIRLDQVLEAPAQAPQSPVARMAAQPRRSVAEAPKARRRRRTADELRVIGEVMLKMLVEEPGSLNTSQIVSGLGQAGHEFDTMRVNGLLKSFEKEGKVADLGGKPKAWRASASLRKNSPA